MFTSTYMLRNIRHNIFRMEGADKIYLLYGLLWAPGWFLRPAQESLENAGLLSAMDIVLNHCAGRRWPSNIHPASRGAAAHTASFFGSPKMLQNIVSYNVFTMCYCKNAVIYTSLGIKSVQNTGFYIVFNTLTSQNPCAYLQCFFHFCPFFPCRKPPKAT